MAVDRNNGRGRERYDDARGHYRHLRACSVCAIESHVVLLNVVMCRKHFFDKSRHFFDKSSTAVVDGDPKITRNRVDKSTRVKRK